MTSFGYIIELYYSVSFYSIAIICLTVNAIGQKDGAECCKFMQHTFTCIFNVIN